MGGDSALNTMTHIIIDEIHERDRFSDFLLTVIKDALSKFRGLKLILMSATVDTQLFLYVTIFCLVEYFYVVIFLL